MTTNIIGTKETLYHSIKMKDTYCQFGDFLMKNKERKMSLVSLGTLNIQIYSLLDWDLMISLDKELD